MFALTALCSTIPSLPVLSHPSKCTLTYKSLYSSRILANCCAGGAADFDVNEQDGQGRSALHFACGYGEVSVVKELLSHKANVTCLDSDKNTPLHYAAGYGETECVKLLLEQCASSLFVLCTAQWIACCQLVAARFLAFLLLVFPNYSLGMSRCL